MGVLKGRFTVGGSLSDLDALKSVPDQSIDNADRKPVSQLLMEAQSPLYSFIYSLLGRSEAASDVLQETNLALLEKADLYDYNRSFMSWACRFAHLQVMAYRKRIGRDRLWFSDELVHSLAQDQTSNLPATTTRLSLLAECVAKLRPEHRVMLQQLYEEGLSYSEIAENLGKKVGGLGSALYRIRRVLHECVTRKISSQALR